MISVPMGLTNFDQCNPIDPIAGVNFDWMPYAGWSHLIIAVEYQLDTDGTVVNRTPGLILEIDGHDYYLTYTDSVIGAADMRILTYLPGIDKNSSGIVANRDQIALPFPIYMRPGDHIKSTVVNLQAGDQISEAFIYQYVFPIT